MKNTTVAHDISSNTQVFTGRYMFHGVNLPADGTGYTVTAYDGTDNTGKVLYKAVTGTNENRFDFSDVGIQCQTGLYVETTAGITVYAG